MRNLEPANIQRVRRLRKEMSDSEVRLWQELRKLRLGFRFRRQHPIGKYAIDFYCPEAKLAVEVDGEHHMRQVEFDASRDAELARFGIKTMRIPSWQLFDDSPVAEWVWRECYSRVFGIQPDDASVTMAWKEGEVLKG